MRLFLIVVGTWAALLLTGAALSRSSGVEMPSCLFRRVAGQPCATCGGTRATMYLLHGQAGSALRMNPLVTVAWFAIPGIAVWQRAGHRNGRGRISPATERRFWVAAGLLFGANWVYLILWGVAG